LREVGHSACRLVDPESPREIAVAIIDCLANKAPSDRKSGLEHAAKYSWESCAGETERILLSLL
jgi:glycosyltransferase involved in cell wall biosynthesis